MTPYFDADGITLYHGDCRDILPCLQGVNAVISDPPFSSRTHAGHDSVEADGYDKCKRSALGYESWTAEDVKTVCKLLPAHGWVCILTDHILARDWERQLKELGRYVFAPLPAFVRGRSVRLSGDGPSSWTDWLIVARTALESRWGTLPGLYEGSGGNEHMGGKPLNMMCRIVEDYSKVGDTVLDFCMGSGTTGVACLRTGRRFIGIEKEESHFKAAYQRITAELAQGNLFREPQKPMGQKLLFPDDPG